MQASDVCPFRAQTTDRVTAFTAPQGMEQNLTVLTQDESIRKMAQCTFETQGLGWYVQWLTNSMVCLTDIYKNGCLNFVHNALYNPETKGYYPFKWVSVFHRTQTVVFTDDKYWFPLFGTEKGIKVTGGSDLHKVGVCAITLHTPLTSDQADQHKKLKEFCMNLNFRIHMVRHSTPEIYQAARQFFSHSCFSPSSPTFVNISKLIPQYVSRANTLALLAPPGSKANLLIKPLLFHADGSPNEEWNAVPEAVDQLGKEVNAEILCEPWHYFSKYFLRRLFQSDAENKTDILKQTTDLLIRKSQECRALNLPFETREGAPIQGQIEAMLNTDCFSEDEIEGMGRLVLVIGQRTTSVAIEACIRHLVLYPEWQDILYEEIQRVLGDEDPEYNKMNGMRMLDNFVYETLRLFPPVPLQAREAQENLSFEGLFIPKGTTMIMAHYLMQRDPSRYTNPEAFNPNRFLDDACSKALLATFGRMPHNCAGRMLALTSTIKCALVYLIRSAEILPLNIEDVQEAKPMGGFILSFDRPIKVCLQSRSLSWGGRCLLQGNSK